MVGSLCNVSVCFLWVCVGYLGGCCHCLAAVAAPFHLVVAFPFGGAPLSQPIACGPAPFTGPLWAYMAFSNLLLAHMSLYGLLCPLWASMGLPGPIWTHMGIYSRCLAYMGLYGLLRASLDLLGPTWASLTLSLLICASLGLSGCLWPVSRATVTHP